jgi:hypothetical protein
MTTNQFGPEVLGPDDLHLASDAFEAALRSVDQATTDVHPYTVRQVLARYIIHQAMRGQRDWDHLREGALAYLAQIRRPRLNVAAASGAVHVTGTAIGNPQAHHPVAFST